MLFFFLNSGPGRLVEIRSIGFRPQLLTSSLADALLYGAFAIFFGILSFVPESTWTRLVQIHSFLLLGMSNIIFVAPIGFGGDLVILLSGGMAYRYGMLKHRGKIKIGVILAGLVSSRLLTIVAYGHREYVRSRVDLAQALNHIVMLAVAGVVMYLVFERELRQIRRDKQRLERLQDENNAFVEFAQNVSGLVHDFKNDLGLFDTFGQLLRISENDRIDRPMIERYERYVVRFSRRVNSILAVTRAAHRQQSERIDVADLVMSTVYVFQSNLHFKRVVSFELDVPEGPVWVHVSPAPLTSILENLIRNGCEALVEQAGDSAAEAGHYRLSVQLIPGSSVTIRVADNGPGIPLCDGDGSENCLYSSKIAAGYTTKENGSGIGLVTIRRHSERSGIPVDLRSVAGQGTSAIISLPESVWITAPAPAALQESTAAERSSAQR